MKKIMTILAIMLMSISVASATTLNVVSDETNEYFDGSSWQNAAAAWVHPAWTTNVNLPATWIWRTYKVTDDEAQQGSRVLFRKVFDVACPVSSADIEITTDNEYTLYVNDVLVGQDGNWEDVEVYDISSYLVSGNNNLTIEAVNAGQDNGNPESNPAGVIYSADIEQDCRDEVPEFGVIGAGLALAGAAFYMSRKRKE